MEHANGTEKQVCPLCGHSNYNEETGVCPDCGFRMDEADFDDATDKEFEFDMTADRAICPVCGKTELLMEGSVCKVCGWFHDLVQIDDPDWEGGQNEMSLNQAREAYSKGLPIR